MFVLCIIRLMFVCWGGLLGWCVVCVFVLCYVYWIDLLLIAALSVFGGCWLFAGYCCCLVFICWLVC